MTLELGPPPRGRLRIVLGAALVLVIIGLVATVLAAMLRPSGEEVLAAPLVTVETPAVTDGGVLVHVLGAVARPGVYRLDAGARVLDAVAAAGGLSAEADPAGVNLARVVADAEQLRIPKIGEVIPGGATGGSGTTGASGLTGVRADGLVDLNQADAAGLETLPGVGPATAARIIRWREANGGFRTVEDLLDVSGIGERTLETLRDLVTV